MDVQFHNWHGLPQPAECLGLLCLPALLDYMCTALFADEILFAGNTWKGSFGSCAPSLQGLPLQNQIEKRTNFSLIL